MKILYFDCNMGAAGDMLTAALTELHPDPDGFMERLNAAGIPDVKIERKQVVKCGIKGAGIDVFVHGIEEDEHMHERHRHHHHRGPAEIQSIIDGLRVSDKVKSDISAVYNLIAEAESHVHGCPAEEIHFHEVGAMDAVADITAVCMLIEELAPDKIIASPIHAGCGHVKCAHGILPVPAPAAAYLLRNVPIYGGEISGELCTPTGAALLKHFTCEFTAKYSLRIGKIGYGMGKRTFFRKDGTEILSAVRAVMGEAD